MKKMPPLKVFMMQLDDEIIRASEERLLAKDRPMQMYLCGIVYGLTWARDHPQLKKALK